MKKIIRLIGINLIMFILYLPMSIGQEGTLNTEICGFRVPSNNTVDFAESPNLNTTCDVIKPKESSSIPIQFTVFRHSSQCTDDRYGITVAEIKAAIDAINKADFFNKNQSGTFNFISDFRLVGVRYVIDDNLSINVPDASIKIEEQTCKDLFEKTPKNEAIQVCIVSTPRSFGLTPDYFGKNRAHNNLIVLSEFKIDKNSKNTFKMELAHELGHYYNLVHTHENTESRNQYAELANKSNNNSSGDFVLDTPADPRADKCTYSTCGGKCAELDTNPNVPQQYEPDMFNIMGYYYPTDRCGGFRNTNNIPFSFTDCQFVKMIHAGNNSRYFLRTSKLRGLAVEDFHAGKILRAQCSNAPISEPLNGKNVSITVAGTTTPYMSTTNSCGRYYGQNNILVPNEGKQVSVKPAIDNTNYRENVNIADAFVLAFHIHSNGTFPTFTAYQKIAADVDNNQRLSFSDVRQIRDLALGRTTVFPAVNSWRYMPSYHENNVSDFSITNPFTHIFKNMSYPNYLDEAKLDYSSSPLDMALYETKAWSFSAIKMGDVSCTPSFQITEPDLILLGDMLNSSTGVGVGTTLSVDVALNAAEDIDAYQFSIAAVPSLKIESVAIGDHFNNDMEGFFHLDEGQNALNHVWYSNTFATQHFSQGHALYRMKVKVLAPISSLENAFRINQTTVPAYRFGSQHRPMLLNLRVNNATYVAPKTNENPLLLSVFPNPAYDKVTFSYKLNNPGNVTISISDNYGRVLQKQDIQGVLGWNEFTTASLNVTPGTILSYTVQSPEGTSRGRILTQE